MTSSHRRFPVRPSRSVLSRRQPSFRRRRTRRVLWNGTAEALGGARSGQDGSVIEVGLVVGFKADEMRIERYRMLAQARLAAEAVRFG